MDQSIEKWGKWIRVIHEDIRALAWATAIYNEVYSVVTSNDAINTPNPFLEWLSYCYSRTALIGLRRQLDHHRDAISMWKLLLEIRGSTQLVSRSNHSCVYGSRERAASDWDRFVGSCHDSYPRDRVDEQIAGLESIKNVIGRFVDSRVAHLDKRGAMPNGGTFGETFQAVSQLKLLAFHWRLVLTGESLAPQVELPEGWKTIFRQPWLPPAP